MEPWLPRALARTPPPLKRVALVQLFRATAAAFGSEMPGLRGLSREQCLQEYARFTAEKTGAALRNGDGVHQVSGRLYRNAYRLGRLPGRLLRIRTVYDVMVLAHFLYGILDIDFEGNGKGEITITSCYFSSFYSPEACQLMSAMDRGLLAGLAGRGQLHFSERITEGRPCCRAGFSLERGSATAGQEGMR